MSVIGEGGRLAAQLSLATSNFRVSRGLELGNVPLARMYAHELGGSFLAICSDTFGCHIAQKLNDNGGGTIKKAILQE